ncbi:thiamine pyrophosphate-binding protein [Polymorphospora sp. NPDC050346]|uniref:thiamine pyrophosphate-binding protein n=1 Tax=Polymorphospora sp. NPDC050346 TaxID=3155780 RepID=UPI0033EE7EA0
MAVRNCASTLSGALLERDFAPFFGTPCGILAPLYDQLGTAADLWTVPREDNAVGVAAGAAMTGKSPVVLMQNSGLGQSVNAIASLVVPYQIPMLLIVSMRGVPPDFTTENLVMGRLTEPLLNGAGIPAVHLRADSLGAQADWARDLVVERRRPAALLVPPSLFGWQA